MATQRNLFEKRETLESIVNGVTPRRFSGYILNRVTMEMAEPRGHLYIGPKRQWGSTKPRSFDGEEYRLISPAPIGALVGIRPTGELLQPRAADGSGRFAVGPARQILNAVVVFPYDRHNDCLIGDLRSALREYAHPFRPGVERAASQQSQQQKAA